jgi:hypothetical protein
LVVLVAALTAVGAIAVYSAPDAEGTGPFVLSGVAESVITIDLGATATTHANCRFSMSTDGSNVASLRGTCYTIAKSSPGGGTPPPPPPPPPPYTNPTGPLTGGGGLTTLSGPISQGDGSVTLQFSPALCLPVDTSADADTIPDAGLLVNVDTTGSKNGDIGNGTVQLDFDTGQQGANPIVCNQVDETDTTPFNPTNLADNHDNDIWGDATLGQTAPDGCTTAEELGLVVTLGGLRDSFNWWDVYNADGGSPVAVAGPDFFAVLGRFGSVGDPTVNPTTAPPAPPAYHPRFDRGASIPGAGAWNLGPADGSVTGQDFFRVLGQFGLDCSAAPN